MIKEAIKNIQNQQMAENVLVAMMVLEKLDNKKMNENLNEGAEEILKKFGIEFEKKSPGVIEYVMKFSKGVGQFIYYAVKKDKGKIKELMDTFKKEDFVDFLLKLDMLTLHMITGPIHLVNAVTGWDLEANIKKIKDKAEDSIEMVKKTLSILKQDIIKFFGANIQPIAIQKVDDISSMIGA